MLQTLLVRQAPRMKVTQVVTAMKPKVLRPKGAAVVAVPVARGPMRPSTLLVMVALVFLQASRAQRSHARAAVAAALAAMRVVLALAAGQAAREAQQEATPQSTPAAVVEARAAA